MELAVVVVDADIVKEGEDEFVESVKILLLFIEMPTG